MICASSFRVDERIYRLVNRRWLWAIFLHPPLPPRTLAGEKHGEGKLRSATGDVTEGDDEACCPTMYFGKCVVMQVSRAVPVYVAA